MWLLKLSKDLLLRQKRSTQARRVLLLSFVAFTSTLVGHPKAEDNTTFDRRHKATMAFGQLSPGDFFRQLDKHSRCSDETLEGLKQDVDNFMTALCQGVATFEPLLAGRLVGTGSFHEGTQVGNTSDFDVDYLWEVAALTSPFPATLISTAGFGGVPQLRLQVEHQGIRRDANMRKLRDRFLKAVAAVLSDADWQEKVAGYNLQLDSASSTSHWVGLIKLTLRWHARKEEGRLVQVDLSPAAKSTQWEQLATQTFDKYEWATELRTRLMSCSHQGFHLLPHLSSHAAGEGVLDMMKTLKRDSLLVVNSPLCEQELLGRGENAVKKTYRLLKLLRDLFLGSGEKQTLTLPHEFHELMPQLVVNQQHVCQEVTDQSTTVVRSFGSDMLPSFVLKQGLFREMALHGLWDDDDIPVRLLSIFTHLHSCCHTFNDEGTRTVLLWRDFFFRLPGDEQALPFDTALLPRLEELLQFLKAMSGNKNLADGLGFFSSDLRALSKALGNPIILSISRPRLSKLT